MDMEITIPQEDPVRLVSAQLEGLDYRNCTAPILPEEENRRLNAGTLHRCAFQWVAPQAFQQKCHRMSLLSTEKRLLQNFRFATALSAYRFHFCYAFEEDQICPFYKQLSCPFRDARQSGIHNSSGIPD